MAARRRSTDTGPLELQARSALRESARILVLLEKRNAKAVAAAAEMILGCFEHGGTVYFCGNGGSAADAQHLAAEFSGRYLVDRPGLPAVALTTNSSAVTAIGNDYGFDEVFARQLEGLGSPGDVLVAITTSGRSESVRRAVCAAQELDMTVIGMTGQKGAEFAALCDVALVSPSKVTPNIQEGHIVMGHAFCLLVERALFPAGAPGAGPRPTPRKPRSTPAAAPQRPRLTPRAHSRASVATARRPRRKGSSAGGQA
jgi:D-sedoheptulose 7-phosphate isomerase